MTDTTRTDAVEVNFDGLVGPTHNYAGLSVGNRASTDNKGSVSNPKQAALQGIAKMRFLSSLGVLQGVLPPHERPHGATLQRLGYGADTKTAVTKAPAEVLRTVSSAAAMWTANAATVSPSADAADGRVHLTPANLIANAHRSIEGQQSYRTLSRVFANERHFVVHEPLPATLMFADEGAANHTRLTWHDEGARQSVQLFVFGRTGHEALDANGRYPRRHTLEASAAVARLHGISNDRYMRQSAAAIDAGAFHNDVVAVGNGNVLLYHQDAFVDDVAGVIPAAKVCLLPITGISLEQAVATYLFNSQLVTVGDASMHLVAPLAVEADPAVAREVERLVGDDANPIAAVTYLDLQESMQNGGGPACLRLRVELNNVERAALAGNVLDPSFDDLERWVEAHYREELAPQDLADPTLVDESQRALDELTTILGLGSIYDFQQD